MAVVTRRKNIQFALAKKYVGKRFTNPMFVEPKLDGLRMAVIVDEGVALTRTGLEVPNAEHIVEQLRASGHFKGWVVDCEGFCDDWNLSQSIIKKQAKHPEADKLLANAFDIISYVGWQRQSYTVPLHTRKSLLAAKIAESGCPNLRYVGADYTLDSMDGALQQKLLREYLNKGYEGFMLKDVASNYSFKKNNDWLKVKSLDEDDFEIIGAKEGRGKLTGMLGAVEIKGTVEWNDKTYNVESEAGMGEGITDAVRTELWTRHLHGKLVGLLGQVEFQEITEEGKLRFGKFVRLRDDK